MAADAERLRQVDPIVLMLAFALAARTSVTVFAGDRPSRASAPVAAAGVARPREAMARLPRPKNRKG